MIHWEGTQIPLKIRGKLTDREHLKNLHDMYHSSYSTTLMEAEQRQSRILDADYSAVDIGDHVDSLVHLSIHERTLLKQTLLRQTRRTNNNNDNDRTSSFNPNKQNPKRVDAKGTAACYKAKGATYSYKGML